ncbi:PAS domain-containing protein [Ferrovibrio sp.]|uniref:PAS domain-containing protein n=1 Tax=Ferrovibrio sp. TaxID=1917215 RepID=UPI00311F889C
MSMRNPAAQKPVTAGQVLRPRLQRLVDYWQAARHGRRLPGRADIDPLQMPWILGDLSLAEVHRQAGGGFRFRFRLVGSRVAERLSADFTGKWLDELPSPDYGRHVAAAFGEVIAARSPFIEHLDMVIDGRLRDYDVLRLPLAADGETVDMVMTAVDFGDS